MKRGILFLTMILLFVLLVGCSVFTFEEENVTEEMMVEDDMIDVEQVYEKEVPKEEPKVEQEPVNLTNETVETKVTISESLVLQKNLDLCPHLTRKFECNKYDLRRCDYETFVGQNDFYPDLINCRDGDVSKGEVKGNRYCLIQECTEMSKDNIVYAWGGPTIFAEYKYSEEKVDGGIMTHYELLSCGEMRKSFESEFDCTVYKSVLDDYWP